MSRIVWLVYDTNRSSPPKEFKSWQTAADHARWKRKTTIGNWVVKWHNKDAEPIEEKTHE
jgi:hypothetical protein